MGVAAQVSMGKAFWGTAELGVVVKHSKGACAGRGCVVGGSYHLKLYATDGIIGNSDACLAR